jgi:hypothetical protein
MTAVTLNRALKEIVILTVLPELSAVKQFCEVPWSMITSLVVNVLRASKFGEIC